MRVQAPDLVIAARELRRAAARPDRLNHPLARSSCWIFLKKKKKKKGGGGGEKKRTSTTNLLGGRR